jgi:hypothetical protein
VALALLLALQAAAAAPSGAIALDFDLAKLRPAEDDPEFRRACRGRDPTEIVVCGRRPGPDYPIEEMERLFREKPVRAEWDIGGGAQARVFVDQVEMPGGQVSKRIMFGIRTPF